MTESQICVPVNTMNKPFPSNCETAMHSGICGQEREKYEVNTEK